MGTQDVDQLIQKNVSYLRKSSGMSRQDLIDRAAQLGVELSESGIRRVELGARSLRAAEAVAIAKVFGLTVDELTSADLATRNPFMEKQLQLLHLLEDLDKPLVQIRTSARAFINQRSDIEKELNDYMKLLGLKEGQEAQDKYAKQITESLESTSEIAKTLRKLLEEYFLEV